MAKKFGGQDVRSLRPVHDPRTGKLLGYVDNTGRQWSPAGERTGGLPVSQAGGYLAGTNYDQQVAASRATGAPPPKTAADRNLEARRISEGESSTYEAHRARTEEARALVASQAYTYAYVDGKRMLVTGTKTDPATGQVTLDLTLDGQKADPYTVPSAYDALDTSAPDPNLQFLMSVGRPATANNTTQKLGLGALLHPAAWAAQNNMTIGQGLTWLASLSVKDPTAYQAMVDKLHNAGYLSDGEYATAGGGFNTAVAQGFAFAARDVSILNANGGPNGAATTLDMFLGQRGTANATNAAAAKGQAYTPQVREYTDPAAIKAAAKDQAQQLLGRLLTPEEENALIGHFRGLEDGMYDQIDAAGRAGTGGSYTKPNAGGQIDSFLDTGALEQEQANYRAAEYGHALKRLFGVAGG